MLNYIMVLIATALIAVTTGFQRLYQKNEGTALRAGMLYNTLMGLIGCVIFFFLSGCRIRFTPYSLLLSIIETLLGCTYLLLGFRVMQEGGMVLFSMFLMTGGMMVPYVWGLLFLDEPFTVLHTIGLVLIALSIVLYNTGADRPSPKLLAKCVLVFFLNGFVSVVSKLHQIETVRPTVSASEFVFWANVVKFTVSLVILLIIGLKGTEKNFRLPGKRTLLPIVAAAAADGISYYLQLKGASQLPATVLYPIITGGAIVCSACLSMIFFHERPQKRGLIGIALCVLGLCLMI